MIRERAAGAATAMACLLAGAALSVWTFGLQSAERTQANRQRAAFLTLSQELQASVRLSDADFRSLTPERQAELRQIAAAVQNDPGVRRTVDLFAEWWASLSESDWEAFKTMSDQDRLAYARNGLSASGSAGHQIEIEFPGPASSRMPGLSLTFEEFGRIMRETVPAGEQPSSLQQELAELTNEDHRTLRLVLWLFENTPAQREAREFERRNRTFQQALLQYSGDEQWIRQYRQIHSRLQGRPFERGWLVTIHLTILGQATTVLGDSLQKQFPVTDADLLQTFTDLEDNEERHALMTAPVSEVRRQLEYLAQTHGDATPEHRLLQRYIRFEQNRERTFRFLTFGFGGPGGPPPESNGPRRGPPPGDRL